VYLHKMKAVKHTNAKSFNTYNLGYQE